MLYFVILIISPWQKSIALHLNKLDIPLPKDALCQVWFKLTQWRINRKCERFTDRRGTTGDQKGSPELKSSGKLKNYSRKSLLNLHLKSLASQSTLPRFQMHKYLLQFN